ncbi:MAG TPA: glycosyltransferase, partial [Acidobacteriota bacterium]|nr:glycosyltransferase [Acidobacteriota bacterium]
MSTSPRILAVCVNWNGRAVLPAALASLRAGGVDPPLIVVDNASTDGSPDWVDLPASRSRLLRVAENRGYGAAVNEAIRRRPTLFPEEPPPDWFLVFNNDVTFSPSALAGLIPFAESTGPGIYGPKIVRWDR